MRLLILGSMDEFVALVKQARERGAYTIVCDGYDRGPARTFADESYVIDVRDVDALADLCVRLRVDALITSFSDVLFESAARISHFLGLPMGFPIMDLPYLRDKSQMKKMFEELGLVYARCRILTPDASMHDLEGLSFPCVLKPVDGYGSHGIHVTENASQTLAALPEVITHAQHNAAALVEEYQQGYEFNTISWICDSKAYLVSIADREKTLGDPTEVPRVTRIVYPSRMSTSVAQQVIEAAQLIADYAHIEYGPLCMQFFWKPGDSRIRFGEVTGRVLGYEHELVAGFADFTIEDLLLDSVMDRDALKKKLVAHRWAESAADVNRLCRCGLYFHGHERHIGCLEQARRTLSREGVYDSLFYYQEGEIIQSTKGGKPYIARAFIEAPSFEALDNLSRTLFGAFSVIDDEGSELVLPNEVISYHETPPNYNGHSVKANHT